MAGFLDAQAFGDHARLQVGQAVDGEREAFAVHDHGPVNVLEARAQVQARMFQQCRAESQAQGRVVVSAGDDKFDAGLAQPDQGPVKERHRVNRWQGPVVDVPGDQNHIDVFLPDGLQQPVDEFFLCRQQGSPVEGAAQVPIGGVQDTHGSKPSDGTGRFVNRLGAPGKTHRLVG